MSGSLDTKLESSIAEIGAHDSALVSLEQDVNGWIDSADGIRKNALAAWQGQAADSFDSRARSIDQASGETLGKLKDYRSAVSTLYYALIAVRETLDGIRDDAVSGGLRVSGTVVHAPIAPTFMTAPDAPPVTAQNNPAQAEYERQVGLWNELVVRWENARSTEAQAHNAFQRACEAITAPEGWARVGAAFGWPTNSGEGFFFATEAAASGSELAGAYAVQSFGRFAYRDRGRYAQLPDGIRAAWEAKDDPKNWQNRPHASGAARGRFAAGRGLWRLAGHVGNALTIYSGAADAWEGMSDQWERDSYDPTLSTAERITRAAAVGVGEAAAPAAGALGGAALGATIGSVVPGVGTLVGGVIGGVLGGLFGGAAGTAIRDSGQPALEEWVDTNVRW